MSSLLDEPVALDTNEYVFAIRRSRQFPACQQMLRVGLHKLAVYLPLQIILEVNRNLYKEEMAAVYRLLRGARDLIQDFTPPQDSLIDHYSNLGAKDGDARICAQLHSAEIKWLISENRHFLTEITDLPFTVLTAEDVLKLLE
jgi:hypothetical protein